VCVYIYPKLLEKVDVKKKKIQKIKKDIELLISRSSYGKKEKEKRVYDVNDIKLYKYIYIYP